jgi:hypothetical protein
MRKAIVSMFALFFWFAFVSSFFAGGPVLAQSSSVTVSLTAVDAKNPTITVTYDGKSKQLELAKDVFVEIDGKKAEYRSLIPGDEAEIVYDKARAVVTRIVVQREPMLPAESLLEGWDEIDQRLIFLMVRLANVEASLDAIEDVLGTKDRLANSKLRDAKRAERANEDMDRNAGGPLKWSQFYGTTAEKFFYHPTDRNSSYHTVTVLGQQGSQADNKVGGGVPSSQGLPIHQRPPQFDYIYRSNERAKTRAAAEAAELRGKLEQLAERRQRLEAEQAGLWVEIAFRAVGHYDLDEKPLYRFEPLLMASDTDSRNRAEAVKATSEFMAFALSIIAESERNQSGTFLRIKPAAERARRTLNDTYLRLSIETTDKQSSIGRFASLAKRLEDVAANLTDSYVVAMEGDSAKDQQRKEVFRAQLQQSLLGYAQILLALDEMASEIKDQYAYKPDVDTPIKLVGLEKIPVNDSLRQSATLKVDTNLDDWIPIFDGKTLNGWKIGGVTNAWSIRDGVLVCNGQKSHLYNVGFGLFKNFHFKSDVKSFPGGNSGVYFHTQFSDQGFPKKGFEIQIDNNTPQFKTGSLFGMVPVNRGVPQDGNWFALEVVVKGKNIKVLIDQSVVMDYTEPLGQKAALGDFERLIGEGIFAIQSNSPGVETHFKNVRVLRLD